MIKHQKCFSRVDSFKLTSKGVLLQKGGGIFERFIEWKNEKVTEHGVTGYQPLGKYLYYTIWQKGSFALNFISSKTKVVTELNVLEVSSLEYVLFRSENRAAAVRIDQGELFSIEITQTDKVLLIHNDSLLIIRDGFLTFLNLLTNEIGAKFKLVISGEFNPKVMNVSRDRILLACGVKGLYELNQDQMSFRQVHFEQKLDWDYFMCSNYKDEIISLHDDDFTRVDWRSFEVTVTNLKIELEAKGLSCFRRSTSYAEDESHIFTIAEVANHSSPQAIGDRALVALNKTTLKIDWKYVFEDSSVNTDCPRLGTDGKLYQLDSNKTLHVFERT